MQNNNKFHSNDSLLIALTIRSIQELNKGGSQCPRGLRRTSAAARLLGLRVRIPPGIWMMSVTCECCVLSGRGLYVGIITSPEESYRLCVCH